MSFVLLRKTARTMHRGAGMRTNLWALSYAVILCNVAVADDFKLGEPLKEVAETRISALLSEPERFLGKTVKIKGTIISVCPRMGCWIEVREEGSGTAIQVKVNDGEIVFPREAKGREVVAQGEFTSLELTRDQYAAFLVHEAEEKGEKMDVSGVREGKTVYRIRGQGAVIRDP